MKRNKIIDILSLDKLIEQEQRVAFHEAGHVAGIHLNNKARQLPPVFFKIIFKDMGGVTEANLMTYQQNYHDCIARVEGGRLIELLSPTIDRQMFEVKDYMMAFEADIINLLIGPLAEAKYIAETDNEPFNHKIVNLDALKNYGGSSDLALVNEYLQSFSTNQHQKDKKLHELFVTAFEFINNDAYWAAINRLASYMLGSRNNIIYCEEVISMLDQAVEHFESRRSAICFR